jgi:hypothetical protein|uniref:Uncharacterized protein n=1 Tax=viral metagenome TaxID=1070528 RepID=A0A6C0IZE9_9ZZZZ
MIDDFILLKDIRYIVTKFILNSYAKIILDSKVRIKKALRKNKSKSLRIKSEIQLLNNLTKSNFS